MRLTNKNTAIMQADQHIHLNSRRTSNYRWNNSINFGSYNNSWFKNPAQDWSSHNTKAAQLLESFIYSIQMTNTSGLRFNTISNVGYNRTFNPDTLVTIEIDIEAIAAQFKDDVTILLYTKDRHPNLWNEKIACLQDDSNHINRNIKDIEYLLVIAKYTKSHVDEEKSTYSYISKDMFDHISETDEILDLDLNPIESLENYSTIFDFNSPFTDGRHYKEALKFHTNEKYLSTVTFLKSRDLINRETLPIIKFPSLLRGSQSSEGKLQKYQSEAFTTGYGLIPYKSSSSMYVYNRTHNQFQNLDFYGFLTYIDPDSIKKYKKAKDTIYDFIENCSHFDGEFFYDMEKYEERKNQMFRGHDKYSDNIIKSFNLDSIKTQVLYNPDASAKTKDLNISSISQLSNNKNYKAYKDIKTTVEELDTNIKNLEREVNDSAHSKNRANRVIADKNSEIERYKRYIENLQQEIKAQDKYIQDYDANLEKNKKKLASYKELHENLSPQKDEIYKTFLDEIKNIKVDITSKDKLIDTFKSQGLHILEIIYRKKTDHDVYLNAFDNPEIMAQIKMESMADANEFELHHIKFKLVKPVIVRVDPVEKGEDCPKIAVGPLIVRINSNSIVLSPLSSNCIFGKEGNSVWLHPHTSSYNAPSNYEAFITSIMNYQATGCLGEASQAFYSAFQAQDPRQAIMAAMTWITSANSSDAWGRNWKYFPKISEIKNLDKDIFQEASISMQEMLTDADEILSNIFESFADDEEEEFNIPSEFVEPTPIVEETQEDLEFEEERNFDEYSEEEEEDIQEQAPLRSAGVQGYVPLYSNT